MTDTQSRLVESTRREQSHGHVKVGVSTSRHLASQLTSTPTSEAKPTSVPVSPDTVDPVVAPKPMSWQYRIAKRTFDIVFSATVLVFTAPLMFMMAVLIRRDSSGPVLFQQVRCGKDGVPFVVYKLRSMYSHTPVYANSPHDNKTDPRITPVGYFLRRSSLDELPQFWCVLKGEMSIVGPRPEMEFIVAKYTPRMRRRLAITPGITGPWQTSDVRKDPIHDNLQYDRYYLRYRSFSLDMLILFKTAVLVYRGVEASVVQKMRRPTVDVDEAVKVVRPR